MNCTIYAALNQCSTTGLEFPWQKEKLPDGKRVELYRDHKGWYRIVLFESDAPDSGISGVIVQADGEIYYKQTARHAQGNNYTRQLQMMLTRWGVSWHRSELLTEAGAACYKDKPRHTTNRKSDYLSYCYDSRKFHSARKHLRK